MPAVSTLLKKLEEISEKAEYLNKRSQELLNTNKELKRQLRDLEDSLQTKEEELENVQTQYEVLKLARSMEGGVNNEETELLKKKINEYIREIDQCLKLIGD